MPTYDYVCSACGHALEIFHSMTEAAKKKCPACGKAKLERKIGAGAGFLFKGAGFYKTDYRSDSYKAGEKAEKEPVSSPETAKAASDKPAESTRDKTVDAQTGASKGSESKTVSSKSSESKSVESKSAPKADPKSKSKKND